MVIIQYSERFLLTLWVGGLWIIGYLVTPVLFKTLDNRQLAGELAGYFFRYISIIGLVCGVLLLVGAVIIARSESFKRWRIWLLLIMIVLTAAGLFVLQPMMQELKMQGLIEGSEQAAQFGRLHGISSVMFLITSIFGLLLVLFRINPVTDEGRQKNLS